MALTATLTNDTPSASFTPSNGVSDAAVTGDFTGTIRLEMLPPNGGTDWVLVGTFAGKGAAPVNTPDFAMALRFRGENLEGSANVYLGP